MGTFWTGVGTAEVDGTEGASEEERGTQERFGRDDTIEVVGTEGASEEGGAQERLGDDPVELWEEDDTRNEESERFLESKRGAVFEEKRKKREASLAPQSRGAEPPWLLKSGILSG